LKEWESPGTSESRNPCGPAGRSRLVAAEGLPRAVLRPRRTMVTLRVSEPVDKCPTRPLAARYVCDHRCPTKPKSTLVVMLITERVRPLEELPSGSDRRWDTSFERTRRKGCPTGPLPLRLRPWAMADRTITTRYGKPDGTTIRSCPDAACRPKVATCRIYVDMASGHSLGPQGICTSSR
jgi:hypothetical protein